MVATSLACDRPAVLTVKGATTTIDKEGKASSREHVIVQNMLASPGLVQALSAKHGGA